MHSKIRRSTESPEKITQSMDQLNVNSDNDEEIVVKIGSPKNDSAGVDVTA